MAILFARGEGVASFPKKVIPGDDCFGNKVGGSPILATNLMQVLHVRSLIITVVHME